MSSSKTTTWRKPALTPVILVHGSEDFFAGEAIKNVKAALRSKHPMLEINEIAASDYQTGELLNLASPSLFAEPRLIIVTEVEKCTDAFIEDGKSYLGQPADETTLLIRHTGSSVRGKALLEAIRASDLASEIVCKKLDYESDRITFTKAQFAAEGRSVTDGAVRALVNAFNADVPELAAAISQLLTDSAENITEDIVNRYYGGRVEADAWRIIAVALEGDGDRAVYLLRHALQTGQDPILLNGGFSFRLRNLAKVHADRRISPAALGGSPRALSDALRDVQGWDDEGLGRVIQELANVDAAAKGAERHPEFRLESLLRMVANKGRVS